MFFVTLCYWHYIPVLNVNFAANPRHHKATDCSIFPRSQAIISSPVSFRMEATVIILSGGEPGFSRRDRSAYRWWRSSPVPLQGQPDVTNTLHSFLTSLDFNPPSRIYNGDLSPVGILFLYSRVGDREPTDIAAFTPSIPSKIQHRTGWPLLTKM